VDRVTPPARAVPVPAGERFSRHSQQEIARALQYAGEASGLKYAVVVREDPGGPAGRGGRVRVGRAHRAAATGSAGVPAFAGGSVGALAGASVQASDDGPTLTDTATWASSLHARMEDPARSVLVAVDTGARAVRIVTGARSGRRLPDSELAGVAEVMAHLFATRGLTSGLVAGLQQLGQVAGPPPRTSRARPASTATT